MLIFPDSFTTLSQLVSYDKKIMNLRILPQKLSWAIEIRIIGWETEVGCEVATSRPKYWSWQQKIRFIYAAPFSCCVQWDFLECCEEGDTFFVNRKIYCLYVARWFVNNSEDVISCLVNMGSRFTFSILYIWSPWLELQRFSQVRRRGSCFFPVSGSWEQPPYLSLRLLRVFSSFLLPSSHCALSFVLSLVFSLKCRENDEKSCHTKDCPENINSMRSLIVGARGTSSPLELAVFSSDIGWQRRWRRPCESENEEARKLEPSLFIKTS